MQQTISITIKGSVQGVFYRQSTKEKAKELGITGFVQNLPGRSVLIHATGTKEQLDALLAWCQVGPPRARVLSVEPAVLPLQSFDGFHIRRTEED